MRTNNVVGVTGMGIVSAIGDSLASFSDSLKRGTSGIRHNESAARPKPSVNIVSAIRDFVFLEKLGKLKNIPEEKLTKAKRLGLRAPFVIQTSILSALQAWEQASLFDNPPLASRIALIIAGQNSTQNHQYGLISAFRENPEYLSPRYALEFLETNQVGVLSELFGIEGEGLVVGGASATGNVGLIKGHQLVESGMVDLCLVVGVVAELSPLDIQGFINIGAMGGKAYIDKATEACRPFDTNHEGFIYGQASAAIIIEATSSSSLRNVLPLAEIGGGIIVLDGNSSANPSKNGELKAMTGALLKARLSVTDIDYINTHGSSSPLGDKTEAAAILKLLGAHTPNVWLNATKGLTGHCLYSAGMVEAIATILQMKEGFLHPNKNLNEPIDKKLKFCGDKFVKYKVKAALSTSFGFGGINTCIVIKRGNF